MSYELSKGQTSDSFLNGTNNAFNTDLAILVLSIIPRIPKLPNGYHRNEDANMPQPNPVMRSSPGDKKRSNRTRSGSRQIKPMLNDTPNLTCSFTMDENMVDSFQFRTAHTFGGQRYPLALYNQFHWYKILKSSPHKKGNGYRKSVIPNPVIPKLRHTPLPNDILRFFDGEINTRIPSPNNAVNIPTNDSAANSVDHAERMRGGKRLHDPVLIVNIMTHLAIISQVTRHQVCEPGVTVPSIKPKGNIPFTNSLVNARFNNVPPHQDPFPASRSRGRSL